ncbi:unnamed protein product [Calypogeia fissa]
MKVAVFCKTSSRIYACLLERNCLHERSGEVCLGQHWYISLETSSMRENSTELEMRLLPAGSFMEGPDLQ